jgi:hypothetical protein
VSGASGVPEDRAGLVPLNNDAISTHILSDGCCFDVCTQQPVATEIGGQNALWHLAFCQLSLSQNNIHCGDPARIEMAEASKRMFPG